MRNKTASAGNVTVAKSFSPREMAERIYGRGLAYYGVHPHRLRAHLWLSGTTVVASLLVGLATTALIVWGPGLEEPASLFASFLLVSSVCLFSVALLSMITPLMTHFANSRLRMSEVELHDFELEQELISLRRQFSKSVLILREVQTARSVDREQILGGHAQDIAELASQLDELAMQ